jgi:hypothetical protein
MARAVRPRRADQRPKDPLGRQEDQLGTEYLTQHSLRGTST